MVFNGCFWDITWIRSTVSGKFVFKKQLGIFTELQFKRSHLIIRLFWSKMSCKKTAKATGFQKFRQVQCLFWQKSHEFHWDNFDRKTSDWHVLTQKLRLWISNFIRFYNSKANKIFSKQRRLKQSQPLGIADGNSELETNRLKSSFTHTY